MTSPARLRPFSLGAADLDRVRQVFVASAFDEENVARACGVSSIARLAEVSPEAAEERTRDPSPLHVLVRLFVIGTAATDADARRAFAPSISVDALVAGGLLAVRPQGLYGAVKITPVSGMLVAFDRSWQGEAREQADHVMGPSDSARTLENLTVRRACGAALDLGSGSGYLGLLAARHAKSVVASDVNSRAAAFVALNARLNGALNLEAVTGDLFEPVADRAFDLIVSNPPFVISPEQRLVYLTGKMKADAFCQRIAREAPRHLTEGGLLQMLCSWVESAEQDWQQRLRAWFEGSGCDVWVMRSSTTDAASYAKSWAKVGESGDADSNKLAAWLAYYAEHGIEAIGSGVVVMRRRSGGDNWFRCYDGPPRMIGPCGSAILERLDALGLLAALDDDALQDTVLEVAPAVRLTQECRPTADGWTQSSARIHLVEGLAYAEDIDAYVGELLAACNGGRSLRAAIARTAERFDWTAADVPVETSAIVRQLVDEGFLVPRRQPE